MGYVITGIRATGIPHLGNYVGSIKPIIGLQNEHTFFQVVEDLHAVSHVKKADILEQNILTITACYLACGINVEKSIIWRQSQAKELTRIMSVLSACTSPEEVDELMDRQNNQGMDFLSYMYPLLMASDTLMVNADYVFVEVDHKNGLAFIKNLAERFNNMYGNILRVPSPIHPELKEMIKGLDGRKMSKSYNNTITILESEERLHELIMDSEGFTFTDENVEKETLLSLLSTFSSMEEYDSISASLKNNEIDCDGVREMLFLSINKELNPIRKKFAEIIKHPDYIQNVLDNGLKKMREHSESHIEKMLKAAGVYY
ncbi:tryptophan--tRNA ligase [Aneurinibacillus thermoaerophilus]|uniref:tryptophan--tRNA ligase n=2 Tax=Aneurinibacillus group TaxID=85151 RepID=UPI002E218C2C|nr:tryptophan--tRNA ligase [Aneurinibacillus thermoaerophilus]MED0678385.1 tryptophan--tRNA ligase [Aneurinibacillus thermoaerophilus]MED0736091.1 tryptophan--tRNA ligase [Aneurinibacillus thermoaerophilus]MED0765588.1 tryptophan--tRNA ligase [Aneurinibacillus thermoaerophilus]